MRSIKLLQINCVYPYGSTGKIVQILHTSQQSLGTESIVLYGRGEKSKEKHTQKICMEAMAKLNNLLSRINGIMYGGCLFSTLKICSIIKKEKPSVVHLHCINGYFVNIFRLVNWLKKNNIPTVLTLHAEFMYTANCGYAFDCERWINGCGKCPRLRKETKSILFDRTAASHKRMKKAFEGFNENLIVASVSPWIMARAKMSPVLKNKQHVCALNGVDTTVFYLKNSNHYRDKFFNDDAKVVLHVTPFFTDDPDHIKGGYWLIRLAEELLEENVKFVVVGNYELQNKIPDNIVLLGRISNQDELAQIYSSADITVLLSKKESFSMIVAESLCCGTPIIGFEAGAPEQITIDEYSEFVENGNLQLLKSIVLKWLNKSIDKACISEVAKEKYSQQSMVSAYEKIYRRLLKCQ